MTAMEEKSTKGSIARGYLIGMILLATLPLMIVAYLSVAKQYSYFEQQLSSQREDFLSMRKSLLQAEVSRISNYLNYEKSNIDQRLQESLSSEVLKAYALIESIDAISTAKTDAAQCQSIGLIETTFNASAKLNTIDLLLLTANGRVLHNDIFLQSPSSLLDTQASDGRYIVRDMIELGKQQGEGFSHFEYADGDSNGKQQRYKAFIKYYPALDLILVGSVQLNSALHKLQQRVLSRLSSLRIGNDNAIPYIIDASGVLLLSNRQPGMVGKNIARYLDNLPGQTFLTPFKQLRNTTEGHFITVNGLPGTVDASKTMFHFVEPYPDWQWLIGASLSLDAMDVQLQADRNGFNQSMFYVVMLVLATIVVAVLSCIMVARRLSAKSRAGFSRLGNYFKDENDSASATNSTVMPYAEFEDVAKVAEQAVEERRYFSEAWQNSEQRISRILQFTGLFILDDNKAEEHWQLDAGLFRKLGYQNVDELQQGPEPFYALVHPKDQLELSTALQHSNTAIKLNFRMQAADGQYRWLEMRGGSIEFDDSGRSLRVLALIRDNSEQQALQSELRSLRGEVDSANALQSQFLASMQQKVQLPLINIVEDTGLLLESQPLTMEQQQYLTAIQDSSTAVNAIFEDILLMSLIDSDAVSLNNVDCDVDELVAAVVDCVSWKAEHKGLQLTVSNNAIGARIYTDQLRLKQILVNLLTNAVKFTRQGSVQLLIEPTGTGGLLFAVKDTGVGMHAAKIEQLGHVFNQCTAQNDANSGVGLRLAIVYRLAELLAANVSVKSQQAVGTSFTLRVPQQPGAVSAEEKIS